MQFAGGPEQAFWRCYADGLYEENIPDVTQANFTPAYKLSIRENLRRQQICPGLACEQAPSEGGKKTFGDRKRDSVSEASGSVDPRAKRVGRGGLPSAPSSPDRSRLVTLTLDYNRLLTYLLTAHHACAAHRAATKFLQPCLSLASFSMVLQL